MRFVSVVGLLLVGAACVGAAEPSAPPAPSTADIRAMQTRMQQLTRPPATLRPLYPEPLTDAFDWHAGRLLWEGADRALRLGGSDGAARRMMADLDLLSVALACPASRFFDSNRARGGAATLLDSLRPDRALDPRALTGDDRAALATVAPLWRLRLAGRPETSDRLLRAALAQLVSAPSSADGSGALLRFVLALNDGDPAAVARAAQELRRLAAATLRPDGTPVAAGGELAFESAAKAAAAAAILQYLAAGTRIALPAEELGRLQRALDLWCDWIVDDIGNIDPLLWNTLPQGSADPAGETAEPLLTAIGLLAAARGAARDASDADRLRRLWPRTPEAAPPTASARRLAAAVALVPALGRDWLAALAAPVGPPGGERIRYFPFAGYLSAHVGAGRVSLRLPRSNLDNGVNSAMLLPLRFAPLHVTAGDAFDVAALACADALPYWPGVTLRPDLVREGRLPANLSFAETVVCGAAVLNGEFAAAGVELRAREEEAVLRAFKSWFLLGNEVLLSVAGVQAPTTLVLPCWQTASGRDRDAWLTLRFARRSRFDRVRLYFDHDGRQLRHLPAGFVLQSSDDGTDWQGIKYRGAVPAADIAAADGGVRDYTFAPRAANFVRLCFPGGGADGAVALVEVMAFSADAPGANLLTVAGVRAWASSSAAGHGPEVALDGITTPRADPAATIVTCLARLRYNQELHWRGPDGKKDEITRVRADTETVDIGPVVWLHDGATGLHFAEPALLTIRRLAADGGAALLFRHVERAPLLVRILPGVDVAALTERARAWPYTTLERDNQAHIFRDPARGLTLGAVFGSTQPGDVAADGPSAFVYRTAATTIDAATAADGRMTRFLVRAPEATAVRLNGRLLDLTREQDYVGLLLPPPGEPGKPAAP